MTAAREAENCSSQDNEAPSPSVISEKDIECDITPLISTTQAVDTMPEGGFEAWMVVAGAWCVGVFQEYYESNTLKQYSASTIAWIVCLEIFFLLAMTLVWGKIYDSYGPRWVLLGDSSLHIFGLMMASISTEYYQILLSQGICSAIGASAIFLPAFNCVADYFNKKRAAAFGVVATGSSTGGVIFPIMVSRLIDKVGYGWAMRISAFVILFMLAIAKLSVKSRYPPQPKSLTVSEFVLPFNEAAFALSCFGNFLYSFGVFIPVTYIVVQGTTEGMSKGLAQYLLAVLNAASLVGRLSAGLLADKFGQFNVFVIVAYFTGILILGLWIPATGNAALIVFSILFGYATGAYASLGPVLVAQISPIQDIGVQTGLYFAVSGVAALTSGPIAGAIQAQDNGSFVGMKIFAGGICIAGSSFVLCVRVYKTGFKFFSKF